MLMLVPMVSHDILSYLNFLWLSWPKVCNGPIDDAIGIMWYQYWCQWHHSTKKVVHLILIILDIRNELMSLTMSFASCDGNANGVTWPNKLCCTSFQSIWTNGKTIGMVKTLVPIVSNEQNSHVYLILIILTQRMQWHHWWCCWHHVTLMLVPMTSNEQKVTLHLISIVLT